MMWGIYIHLILCGPMDCSLPGSSVHRIFQARILEWVATSYPRDLPDPGIKPVSLVSLALASGFFIISTTWEASYIYTHPQCNTTQPLKKKIVICSNMDGLGGHYTNKGSYNQSYGFSRSHVWILELDHNEG